MESRDNGNTAFSYRLSVLFTIMVLSISFTTLDGVENAEGNSGPLSIDAIYWPMMGRDVYNTNEGTSPSKGLQDPDIKWTDTVNSTSLGAVGADMRENVLFSGVPTSEKKFVIDSNGTHCFVKDADNGRIAWQVDVRDIWGRITDQVLVSPALLDTDGDLRSEVLVPVTSGNQHNLALFEPNITLTVAGYSISSNVISDELIWNFTTPSGGALRTSSPTIHDITMDGVEDIIVGAGNSLHAYHGVNGKRIWELDIGVIGEALSTPAIYPGTGAIRRIVVNSLLPELNTLRTTIVNYQGDHLKNITSDLTPAGVLYTHTGNIPVPVISDVTGDVTKDILIPYPANLNYGRIIVYTYTLEEMVVIDDIIGRYEGGLTVADLNSDSSQNIIIQSKPQTAPSSFVAYRVYWDGARYLSERLWTRSGASSAALILDVTPLSCDLNSDGVSDVVFPNPGTLYAILSDGTYYWNMTIPGPTPDGFGMIGDLSSDDFCDIYLNGRFISQKLIDLKVKDPQATNIYLNDPEPIDGNPVTINCIVENTRGTEVDGVVVRFRDLDDPDGPSVIGYDILDLVDTAEASVVWVPDGDGDHRIEVLLDPDGNITETDETNNQGLNNFIVAPAYGDLTVTSIGFIRGDGLLITDKHLVVEDPSKIRVEVKNIGQKQITGSRIRVNVDGAAPAGGQEYTDVGTLKVSEARNITVSWTPQREGVNSVEVWIEPPSGETELSAQNNYLKNDTDVKGKEPVGSLYLQGIVTNTEGDPESDVRMTLTVDRTGEGLGPIETGSDGMYGFDMNFIEYLDGDTVTVRGSKDMLWGENGSKIYSEDVVKDLPVNLTDLPTLSIFISPVDETEYEVIPNQKVEARFNVENNGNIAGNVSITKTIEGNGTLKISDVITNPNSFSLDPDTSRQVAMDLTIPEGEIPGTEIIVRIKCSIIDDTTVEKELIYTFTVTENEDLIFQMISEADVVLGPDEGSSASFEFYIYNRGNVPLSYQMSVSSSLEDHSTFRDGSGTLDIEDSTSPFLDIVMPNSTNSLTGSVSLSTSGLGTVATWDISLTVVIPNLEISGVISTDPADVLLGDEILLIASIMNSGSVSVGDIRCTFYDDTTEIGSKTVSRKMEPDEVATITGIRWTPQTLGEHQVTFRIDPLDRIRETDEDDNTLTRNFNFIPDLSIKKVEMGSEFGPGETAIARITVENEGNSPLTDGFMATVTSGSRDGEQLVSSPESEVLDPLMSREYTFDLQFDLPERSGNLTIYFSVSPQNDDGEEDLTDNWIANEVDIRSEDEGFKITDYMVYIIIAVVLLVAAGAAFYIWKFGLPIAPPPGEDETPPSPGEVPEEGPVVEDASREMEEGSDVEDVPEMDLSAEDDDVPVLEMGLIEGPQEPGEEPVMVAEVVEVEEIPVEDEEITDDEEEMIPEV